MNIVVSQGKWRLTERSEWNKKFEKKNCHEDDLTFESAPKTRAELM